MDEFVSDLMILICGLLLGMMIGLAVFSPHMFNKYCVNSGFDGYHMLNGVKYCLDGTDFT